MIVHLLRRFACSLRPVGPIGIAALAACGGGGDPSVTSPPPQSVASVTVVLSSTSLRVGGTLTATADLKSATGALLAGRTVTWASSDPSVATVGPSGVVTGVSVGTAAITATSEGKAGTSALSVVPAPVQTVSVAVSSASLIQGTTATATATLQDDRGQTLSGRSVAWASNAPTVATVDGSGLITAVGVGAANIIATSEGRSGQASITVLPVPVATVLVTLSSNSVAPGGTVQATAIARDASGNALSGRAVTWSSSSPAIATVNALGLVTAVGSGTSIISATVEGRSGQASLTVQQAVTAVTFSGSVRQKVGDAYQMAVTMRVADGSIVSRNVVWKIREAGRASVNQSGLVTPLISGNFTLVAEVDGVEWSANYTSYDWEVLASGGTSFLTLAADVTATNRSGTANYPELVISCGSSGYFFVWIRTPHIITANGTVAYSLDGGTIVAETWDELSPNFNTLWKRGSNTSIKTFAVQLASARRFLLAFGEFLGASKLGDWRVSGLSDRLPPLISQCPAAIRGSLAESAPESAEAEMLRQWRLLPSLGAQAPAGAAEERATRGAMHNVSPLLSRWPVGQLPDSQAGQRRRR
ncbi:MAG: Ig-like domain-containing protein [Gemmatimonadetes bacterium]|nr:Ig-like domain-containing protein [Gemmatimonadota bacterium]